MDNKEKKNEAVNYIMYSLIAFFIVFWPLVLGKVPNDLFWLAIGFEALCLMVCVGAFLRFGRISDEQEAIERKQKETEVHIEQNRTRIIQQEEARLKAKEDEKKAERAKLARLLDEL